MKHPKLSAAIILSVGLLFSCACNNPTTSSSAQKTTSNSALTGKDGRFSYTINGDRVETVNNVQNANLYINEVSNDATNGTAKIEVTCSGSNVFDFVVGNSGTTTIDNHQASSSGVTGKTKASYMDGKTLRNLYAVSVTVTVTSLDNSRISGTFSGTFKADETDGGATASVTSGSFNLPLLKH